MSVASVYNIYLTLCSISSVMTKLFSVSLMSNLLLSVAAIIFTKHCAFSCVHVVDVASYCIYFSIVGQISEIVNKRTNQLNDRLID